MSAVPVSVETGGSPIEVDPVAEIDSAVDGRACATQTEVSTGLGDEARVAHYAVATTRELEAAAEEQVVVLVERPVRVADLGSRHDDVVPHAQDVGGAAAVAHEAPARGPREVDGVVEETCVANGPAAARVTPRHQSNGLGQRGADDVVRERVVGRATLSKLGEGVVVDCEVVVDRVFPRAEELDRRAVAAVVIREGIGVLDRVVGDLVPVAVNENAEGPRVIVLRPWRQDRHPVVIDEAVAEDRVLDRARLDVDAGRIPVDECALDAVTASRYIDARPRAVVEVQLAYDDVGAGDNEAARCSAEAR